jgi:NTP pyrophosphatase (non-canonical NTP hydrolase)
MTGNEYQKAALRTASGMNTQSRQEWADLLVTTGIWDEKKLLLLNGVLGLAGEGGECDDMVKKHLFQGHPLDKEHMAKELGDVAWYLAIAAQGIGYDLDTIFQMNVDKLMARYPDGFDPEKSLNRKAGDV